MEQDIGQVTPALPREYWLCQDAGIIRLYDVTGWQDEEKEVVRASDGRVCTFLEWAHLFSVFRYVSTLYEAHRSKTPRPYVWELRVGTGPAPTLTIDGLDEGTVYTLVLTG